MPVQISRDRYLSVDQRCQARDGNRYGYGGAFTLDPADSTDCSGLVLQTGAWLMGRTDWPGNRYGSTESFRLDHKIVYDLGFRRMPRGGLAALSFKPIMLVGLQHGGGGIYSHTACTLFGQDAPGGPVVQSARGVDWESRGDGIYYYEGARAWNDNLFHDFWYLDATLADPVAPPVANQIDLEAAREPWLGQRRAPGEKPCKDGVGRYAPFEHGAIYWHPAKTGKSAVAVPAEIIDKWASVSWEQGPLGYPVADRAVLPDGVAQAFQGGAIYRGRGRAAFIVHGAIGRRFAAAGFEKGWGWPLSDETVTADGGREQRFELVTAIWHPTGVVTIKGKP